MFLMVLVLINDNNPDNDWLAVHYPVYKRSIYCMILLP